MDGESLFVGDLVYVAPGADMQHTYKGWLCYVSRIPFDGNIVLHLGMPPQRVRRATRANLELRRGRPDDPVFQISSDQVRVMNMALPE